MTGMSVRAATSSAERRRVSRDSRTKAKPMPTMSPAATASTPLRSGLGLEGACEGCAASPTTRPPVSSDLSTWSWLRWVTSVALSAGFVAAAICWFISVMVSLMDFCCVCWRQATNWLAKALAKAAACRGSLRVALTVMTLSLGSDAAVVLWMSVLVLSFQPSCCLAMRAMSGVTTKVASVASVRTSGGVRSTLALLATLSAGDCVSAMMRAVEVYCVGRVRLTATTRAGMMMTACTTIHLRRHNTSR